MSIRVEGEWLVVNDRRWWGDFDSESPTDEFKAELSAKLGHPFEFERRQFIVRFESGWRVSIIWGSMTYSDNHEHGFGRGPYDEFVEQPDTVEVAIINIDGNLDPPDPFGYVDHDSLNLLLDQVAVLGTHAAYDDSPTSPGSEQR